MEKIIGKFPLFEVTFKICFTDLTIENQQEIIDYMELHGRNLKSSKIGEIVLCE